MILHLLLLSKIFIIHLLLFLLERIKETYPCTALKFKKIKEIIDL